MGSIWGLFYGGDIGRVNDIRRKSLHFPAVRSDRGVKIRGSCEYDLGGSSRRLYLGKKVENLRTIFGSVGRIDVKK